MLLSWEGGGLRPRRHRSQTAHACSAPLDYTARNDALTERRARARELIAQKFPDRKDRVIPKPPPQRDVVKARPLSPDRLPPSLQPASPPGQQIDTKIAAAKPVKTKADKMRELHVRKLRSLATPLDPKMRADGERRFFEWSVGSKEDAETWRTSGKSSWKLSKVWVPQVRSQPLTPRRGRSVDVVEGHPRGKDLGSHD